MARLIYIQGSQGVGKSTLLADYINSTELNIKRFDNIARSLIKKGVSHGIEAAKDDYFAYIHRHIYNHNFFTTHRNNYDLFISDRSIIDVIVYSLIRFNEDEINYVYELCCEFYTLIAKDIDEIFYIPIEFEMTDDGVREFSKNKQLLYDSNLVKVFNTLGINYFTISGNPFERTQKISNRIDQLRLQ